MNSTELHLEPELLTRIAELLDNLKPFPANRREDKWRTTEQIARELGLFAPTEIDDLDKVLQAYEARCRERLENGLPPEALIRRAKYPDRTTALPLWGSVKRYGPPWLGLRPDRSDPPDDIPSTLHVPEAAPHVFLSHTHQDRDKALHLAEALAAMEIGAWRFETHIDQRGHIADCVRKAIAEAACSVALVTRYSIASLWVLTELETSLQTEVPIVLVVDAEDRLLLRLLQSVKFPHPDLNLDETVECDPRALILLEQEYPRGETESRRARYALQVCDFLATLPSYLGSVPPGSKKRVWQAALAFPHLPTGWSGTVKLNNLQELRGRLKKHKSDAC
jgi:hypothetical protein